MLMQRHCEVRHQVCAQDAQLAPPAKMRCYRPLMTANVSLLDGSCLQGERNVCCGEWHYGAHVSVHQRRTQAHQLASKYINKAAEQCPIRKWKPQRGCARCHVRWLLQHATRW